MHDLLLERQRVPKGSQKRRSIQDKKRNLQKENVAAREKMRKLKEDVKQKEERVPFLSDGVEKMKELKRKWKQNFKVCRQGRKE